MELPRVRALVAAGACSSTPFSWGITVLAAGQTWRNRWLSALRSFHFSSAHISARGASALVVYVFSRTLFITGGTGTATNRKFYGGPCTRSITPARRLEIPDLSFYKHPVEDLDRLRSSAVRSCFRSAGQQRCRRRGLLHAAHRAGRIFYHWNVKTAALASVIFSSDPNRIGAQSISSGIIRTTLPTCRSWDILGRRSKNPVQIPRTLRL